MRVIHRDPANSTQRVETVGGRVSDAKTAVGLGALTGLVAARRSRLAGWLPARMISTSPGKNHSGAPASSTCKKRKRASGWLAA